MKRSYEDFRVLDKHLHLCIYDRRYSQLTELPRYDTLKDTDEVSMSITYKITDLPEVICLMLQTVCVLKNLHHVLPSSQ